MENVDDTTNEKPKGNMLQNENRKDEASPENAPGELNENITKIPSQNIAQQPPVKTDRELGKNNV